jgi:tRNA threonylcarbamoyladenosine biosynthesis protein TsaB
MITLAADTSTITASCAVVENGKVLSEISMQYGKTHSQKIVPMLKELLTSIDRKLCDVDLFSAAIGPGSFTGLRIGVVTIKSLAYSLKKPVCGIPTLDSLAYTMPDFKGIIAPMLDARNNQVYAALYRKSQNSLEKISPVMGVPIGEFISTVKSYDEDILILGDAAPIHMRQLIAELGDKAVQAQFSLSFPRAASCALLAEQAFHENKAVHPFEMEPMYFRKSQAERMRESGKD